MAYFKTAPVRQALGVLPPRRIVTFRNGRKRVQFVPMGDAGAAESQCQAGCLSIDETGGSGVTDQPLCLSACTQPSQNACVTACNNISDPTNYAYCSSACGAIPQVAGSSSPAPSSLPALPAGLAAPLALVGGSSLLTLGAFALGAYFLFGKAPARATKKAA